MHRTLVAPLLAMLFAAATPALASAQERNIAGELAALSLPAAAPHWFDQGTFPPASSRESERGPILTTLYLTLAAANALDAYTTMHSLSGGAREVNPMMQGVAGNNTALWAVKSGASALAILGAERMWRNNRRGAAITALIVSNAVMLAVAGHNARVMRAASR